MSALSRAEITTARQTRWWSRPGTWRTSVRRRTQWGSVLGSLYFSTHTHVLNVSPVCGGKIRSPRSSKKHTTYYSQVCKCKIWIDTENLQKHEGHTLKIITIKIERVTHFLFFSLKRDILQTLYTQCNCSWKYCKKILQQILMDYCTQLQAWESHTKWTIICVVMSSGVFQHTKTDYITHQSQCLQSHWVQ